jgi:hypothetical protein
MVLILIVLSLVLVLYGLIFAITQIRHYPPQAYYLKKKRGATVAYMVEHGGEPPDHLTP